MKYIALTIGPIYKTLKNAKKPKELFSASYIFSYIMREIIKEFKNREFITPYIKDENIFDSNSEVGLFHDRSIFKSKDGDLEKLKNKIDEVCKDIAKNLDITKEQVLNYLQINYLEKELDESANPIEKLMPYLDTKELFYQISQDDTLAKKLKRKKGDEDNFLTKGKKIVDDLKKLSYNKYFCIVHADGDKMSKAIEDKNNIEKVSKSLFEFCLNSSEKIKDFGGQTIFAGGDDLLFFAPVVSRDKKETIFDLCENIGEEFQSKIPQATLSFGLSVQYIKYPLYEALEDSRELLFAKAKDERRNNIAYRVTKHSGQFFEDVVHKEGDKYKKFLELLKLTLTGEESDNDKNFLHSLHHKIKTYEKVLEQIKNDKEKLKNFFEHYFNEAGPQEYKSFFEKIIEYINTTKDLNGLYSALRFIKFIKGDKK